MQATRCRTGLPTPIPGTRSSTSSGAGAILVLLARGLDHRGCVRLALVFGVFYTGLAVLGVVVHHPLGLRLDRGENVFHLLVGPITLAVGLVALRGERVYA